MLVFNFQSLSVSLNVDGVFTSLAILVAGFCHYVELGSMDAVYVILGDTAKKESKNEDRLYDYF